MPTTSYSLQRRVARFRDQRWLLDKIIEIAGPEFDQSRLQYYSAPMSPDHRGPVMGLKNSIHRWEDLTREWPIFDNTELNLALERKKADCYLEFTRLADHKIEPVEIPYGDHSLAGYFHLPMNYQGGKLPCLVMISGMDAFKEVQINASADRFLRRGFACLMLDGPGQGTSLPLGIWYDPERYGEVGRAAWEAMASRKEIDAGQIMVWGLSFGSFWATQMAAAEPRYRACAVMYTCFQPNNWPLYEMASPSFKQRFMYMTNVNDEADFQAVMAKMDVMQLGPKLHMPYFVMAGKCPVQRLWWCLPGRSMAWEAQDRLSSDRPSFP